MARVLLIDDDEQLRALHAEVLQDEGHEAIHAATGAAGIEAIRTLRPDLVLCDVDMPGLDGYAVLGAVRADPEVAATPFLFLTGMDVRHHFRAAMSLGADDYLAKPVRIDDLLAAVNARLARRAADRRDSEQRVEELRRTMTFLLPHELRTPLTVILGGSEMLRELHQELSPAAIAEMATAISKAAQRLHRLAENYLLNTGMELERLTAAAHGAALSGTAEAAVVREAAVGLAREYGRERDLKVAADAPLPLAEPYVRKIVAELVDNALKFSAEGRPVSVSCAARDGRVVLSVADEGRGMTPGQISEVGAFRQFNRAVFEQQGSGLGLALVKGLVEASGGAFAIESQPGGGTTVTLGWTA
jgi:signal transduction histidine kinase